MWAAISYLCVFISCIRNHLRDVQSFRSVSVSIFTLKKLTHSYNWRCLHSAFESGGKKAWKLNLQFCVPLKRFFVCFHNTKIDIDQPFHSQSINWYAIKKNTHTHTQPNGYKQTTQRNFKCSISKSKRFSGLFLSIFDFVIRTQRVVYEFKFTAKRVD